MIMLINQEQKMTPYGDGVGNCLERMVIWLASNENRSAEGERMSLPDEIIVVFSAVPPDRSGSLAKMLVDQRIVACVNIVPVRSYYRWKGEFCDEQEHLLIAKTTKEKAGEVIAAIKSLHPYEVPEIVVLPVTHGYPPYLEWVRQETH